MKVAVVDDEKKISDLLTGYIKQFGEENNLTLNVAAFHNPNDFLTNYTKDYDLILMDVEMPGLNGIETAKELRRMDKNVVLMFITNMSQYAIHGYEVEAIDFVIKPVAYMDFALKLQKAMRYIKQNSDHKIVLNTQEGIVHVNVSDIFYVEVIRHYLVYHTVNGDYTVRGVMKETQQNLSEHHFVRSNQCYLINLKYVESIYGSTVKIAGEELQMSRNKKNDVMLAFTKYVGGIQ